MPIPLYWSTGRYVMNSIQPTGIFSIHHLFWFRGFHRKKSVKSKQMMYWKNTHGLYWVHYICSCLLRKHLFCFFRLSCLNFQRSKSNVITTGRLQVYLQNTPFGRGGACIGLKPSGFALGFLANTCSPSTSGCILQYTFSHPVVISHFKSWMSNVSLGFALANIAHP